MSEMTGSSPDDATPSETASDVTIEATPRPATEHSETVAEPEGQQEQKTESTPEELQRLVADRAFKERQARREADVAKQELAQLKAEQAVIAQGDRPVIPEIPAQYDDDFDQRLAARETAIQEAAQFDSRASTQRQIEDHLAEQQAQAQQKALNDASLEYERRGHQLGISEIELRQAGERLTQYQLTNDELTFLLTDEMGPAMTKFLSDNPLEMETFSQQPIGPQRLVFLATDIKSKAGASKRRTTETPDPPQNISGGGVPQKQSGPEGATYE